MNIRICAPSYKRPIVKSFDYFRDLLFVYVDEEEYPQYVKNNPKFKDNFIKLKKGIQGNVARVRNYILEDNLKGEENDAVCIVDDDISYLGFYEKNKKEKLEYKDIKNFLEKYTLLCREWGFRMWGVNLNADKQLYRECSPFSTLSVCLGPFSVFLKGNECRYDEKLPLKEDYDICLQNFNKYRGILRVNKFHYECEQSTNQGGCATYRNLKKEIDNLKLLQKKWGNKIVRIDFNDRSHKSRKIKKIDYNPIVICPIKGI